jgi:ATP-dependent DNA helicase RecQ
MSRFDVSYDRRVASDVLRSVFGYQSFRPQQEAVVEAVLRGRDTLTVLATGSGKSLLYQFPSLYVQHVRSELGGGKLHCATTVVVSPLLSLMQNQTQQLSMTGVKTAIIGSNTPADVASEAVRGGFAVLYITPEKLEYWMPQLHLLHEQVKAS